MVEKFANNATTTLSSSILSSDTSITVVDASKFSSAGTFRIIIDSEIILVTAVSSNTFTVTRGQEGTIAAAHSSGSSVIQILTAAALAQFRKDVFGPTYVSLGTDTAVSGTTVTDLASTVVNGTSFFIQGEAMGLTNSSQTPRLYIKIDATTVVSTYGISVPSSGFATGGHIFYLATGLSSGNHTITLQASTDSGTVWTVHANTNPTLEGARLVVIPTG